MPPETTKDQTKDTVSPPTDEKGYFMTYIKQGNPFNIKGFKHAGDLRSARNRAFKHGQIMGYKNVWVFPMFANLLDDERGHVGESNIGENVSPREFQKEVKV